MEIEMKPELLNLPWVTLLTLACGYAGYYIANAGPSDRSRLHLRLEFVKRRHRLVQDIAFQH